MFFILVSISVTTIPFNLSTDWSERRVASENSNSNHVLSYRFHKTVILHGWSVCISLRISLHGRRHHDILFLVLVLVIFIIVARIARV